MAWATYAFIRSCSASLAGRSLNPTTTRLTCCGETPEATFMEMPPAASRSKYSLKVDQSVSMPLRCRCSATYSSNTGPTSGATV